MNKRITILTIVVALLCATPAFAGLKVTDNGYKVTATSGDGRTYAHEGKGYTVDATPPDCDKGFALASQMSAKSAAGLNQAIQVVLTSGILSAPQPRTVYVPVRCPQPLPVYRPCPPPRTLPATSRCVTVPVCNPCQAPSSPAQNVRRATIRARWDSASQFKAHIDGRERTFIVPIESVHLYRNSPTTLTGWLYHCPLRPNCPLMFRDSATCVDIRDP